MAKKHLAKRGIAALVIAVALTMGHGIRLLHRYHPGQRNGVVQLQPQSAYN